MGPVLTVDDTDSGHSVTILVEGLPTHPRSYAEQETDQQGLAPKLPVAHEAVNACRAGRQCDGVHMFERERNPQLGMLACYSVHCAYIVCHSSHTWRRCLLLEGS